jgi:capsule polysaccharide export protein KpsE/RkpR
LLAYADLSAKADGAVDRYHDLSGEIQKVEAALTRNGELKAALIDYAKTRPVFDGYKTAKYSRAYLSEHDADIVTHRAARATFTRLLDGGKLPKMDALKAEWQKLTADKKALYSQYRAAQKEMREVIAVRSNVDHLLGVTGGQRNREAERS